ncbi:MAG: zf-HC2 domain-containing protein, partial [Vicinamibacterales bacterium]
MTPPDARDRGLEAVLRRQAHAAAQASDDCLDAETLAAWADDGLDPASRAAAEAHAADCARCQAMLAAIVRTTPEPAPSAAPTLWERLGVRWLVPLTAAAAAVVLWIVVPPAGDRPADTLAESPTASAPAPEDTLSKQAEPPPPPAAALPPARAL